MEYLIEKGKIVHIRVGDSYMITLTRWEEYCGAMEELGKRVLGGST